jgi:soluble lytic murein transglycosylase-like protein
MIEPLAQLCRTGAKLCFCLVLADAAFTQTVSGHLYTPPDPEEQYQRAKAAMQASLDRQQQAVRATLSRVAQSSSKDTAALLDAAPQALNEPSADHDAPPEGSQQASAADHFFSTPWAPAEPLRVPNVQMLDDACTPLETHEIDRLAQDAAQRNRVSVDLLKSVMRQESGFKPCALSVAGAMGLMQIMPDTAETLHLDDPFDPAKNVDAGAKFLRMMLDRYKGDTQLALGAYNAGPARVDKAGGVPSIPETVGYVNKVMAGLPDPR